MNFQALRKQAQAEWKALNDSAKTVIKVGTATCGRSAGSLETLDALKQECEANKLECIVMETGCMGPCFAEPLVSIKKPGGAEAIFANVDRAKAQELVKNYLIADNPAPEYQLGNKIFESQARRVLALCGVIDPMSLEHYLANGGYEGLEKALNSDGDVVIYEMERSGLRGRGGAGFPTWKKWQFCKDAEGDEKYLICNADEGDPGAFMNRSLIEGNPHLLLEGMLIAGFAIGASHAYVYCRAEYPLALERLRLAIKQAKDAGLLGENILGSEFSFDVKIKEGAGAFVCGEETALIASVEGNRGMPRPRPPFPAISGLWNSPTTINNVETLCSVSLIMKNGAEWFSEYGTQESKGTKTFALVGKTKHPGLVEVPLGITLREMIFDIGGGVLDDVPFKAVQTGGPSGGCIPASILDTPVDYDSLKEAGSIMGSGGMVVMDDNTCMVDFARYFLDFTQKESCGKCVPCRLGTKQMLVILEDIAAGKGKPSDMDLLLEIGEAVKAGALCGLGQTAPNPVLSTLRYFKDEYLAHINDKKCPAGVCRALIEFSIDKDKCTGCTLCTKKCPSNCITGEKKQPHVIDKTACIKCGMCAEVCKFAAVKVT